MNRSTEQAIEIHKRNLQLCLAFEMTVDNKEDRYFRSYKDDLIIVECVFSTNPAVPCSTGNTHLELSSSKVYIYFDFSPNLVFHCRYETTDEGSSKNNAYTLMLNSLDKNVNVLVFRKLFFNLTGADGCSTTLSCYRYIKLLLEHRCTYEPIHVGCKYGIKQHSDRFGSLIIADHLTDEDEDEPEETDYLRGELLEL